MNDASVDDMKLVGDDEIITGAEKLVEMAKEKGRTPRGGSSYKNLDDSETDWIVKRFKSYLKPHPDNFGGPLAKIRAIETAFGSNDERFASADLESMDTAKNRMNDWQGRMADNLVKNFLEPMPVVAANHGAIAKNLTKNLEAMKAVHMSARQDVNKIAEKGLEALDATDDCDAAAWAMVLSIALALAGPAGVALSGARTAVQLGFASVAAAGSIGGEFVEEGEEVELGADSVPQVLDNIREALDKVDERVKREEDEIIDKLKEVDKILFPLMRDGDAETPIVSRQPDIVGADTDAIRDRFVQLD